MVLGGLTAEERLELDKERQTIKDNSKAISECTLDELQDLRQQLFELYQKHSAIGSTQIRHITSFIKQVEFREMMIAGHRVKEPVDKTVESPTPKNHGKILSKSSSYNWSIDG